MKEIDLLAIKLGIDNDQVLNRLRDQYNGYHFGIDIDTGALSKGVYNSFGLNNVFEKLQFAVSKGVFLFRNANL